MDEIHGHSDRVAKEDLRAFMGKRDAPGLLRLLVQLPLFLGSALWTARLAATGNPAWLVTVTLCGAVLATLFPPLHEAGHGTAFRSAALNRLVHWLCAVLMLQSPAFFREFHWEHHRQTQSRTRDPEIAMAPELLDDWPRNPLVYLFLLSGQPLMLGKVMLTLACAVMPTAAGWEKLFPYVRPSLRRKVAWESRAVIALLAGLCIAGLRLLPGFGAVLLAWPIAHFFLGIYLMAEHTGLPNAGTQLERTRTIGTNALVRFFMWNMPYHAEHHAYPAVTFHALPALHERLAPELLHVARGYLSFHAEALRHALSFGKASRREL